ncbi:MAG: NfeD family protein [Endomicrobiales bacterium]|nr:NfeD family protein [Endomicrobiales bacterium]
MSWSYWIIVAVVLFIVEILSPGIFFFACLGIGALSAGVVTSMQPAFWIPWVVFLLVSLFSMYFIRPLAKKFFQPSELKKTNVDALLGQKAWVMEAIEPPNLGTVKIEGELWRAEATNDIEANIWVKIVEVKGSHLKVKK